MKAIQKEGSTNQAMSYRKTAVCVAVGFVLTAFAQNNIDRWQPSEQWLREFHPHQKPPAGFVSKKATALTIGRAAIVDRYDEEILKELEPLDAKRLGAFWIVYSDFPLRDKDGLPTMGGVTTVQISAKTGEIINVNRGM